jgi:uncharacterized protein YuzE
MKVRYDREEDVLLIEMMPEGVIDHAEQMDSVIIHLSRDGRLVLLEILDAGRFLSAMFQIALRGEEVTV